MLIARLQSRSGVVPVCSWNNATFHDVSGAIEDWGPDTLTTETVDWFRQQAAFGAKVGERPDLVNDMVAPLTRPHTIVGIGLNYRDHQEETGMTRPDEPPFFLKAPTSLSGPNDLLLIPPSASKLDWEVEIGIVLGRRLSFPWSYEPGRRLPLIGSVLAGDFSERDWQMTGANQWSRGKSFDTWCPLGPWIDTDHVPGDKASLQFWLAVNGDRMQESSDDQLISSIAVILTTVTRYLTLHAGDVILTGTPAGVAFGTGRSYLTPGDVVTMGADRLGQQNHLCVAMDSALGRES